MANNKSTAALAGPRSGRPPATDERDFVLPLFRQAGRDGINRLHFLQGTGPLNGRLVTQIGRLINSLEKEGFVFLHERRDDSRFVYYTLVAEPQGAAQPQQIAKPSGWRSRDFAFGNPANRPKPPASAPTQEGLFGQHRMVSNGCGRFVDFESGRKGF
jgi:hypothetical protein